MSFKNMATFKHKNDSFGGSESGSRAIRLFKAAVRQAQPDWQVTPTQKSIDIHGVDLVVAKPTGETATFEITSHQDPYCNVSKTHLRVTVGSLGNDHIKTMFNAKAKYWAFYNPLWNKTKILVYTIENCREYLTRNWGEVIASQKYTEDKYEAIFAEKLYRRDRRGFNSSDLILYVPITQALPYAAIMNIPEAAIEKEDWDGVGQLSTKQKDDQTV